MHVYKESIIILSLLLPCRLKLALFPGSPLTLTRNFCQSKERWPENDAKAPVAIKEAEDVTAGRKAVVYVRYHY